MRRRPIPSTGGAYWAGDDGTVWRRTAAGGWAQQVPKPDGSLAQRGRRGCYLVVSTTVRGVRRRRPVHRLVAEAWLGGFVDHPLMEVHHADGNPRNNAASNLVCMTSAEHRRLHGQYITADDVENCRAAILADTGRDPYPAELGRAQSGARRARRASPRRAGNLEQLAVQASALGRRMRERGLA